MIIEEIPAKDAVEFILPRHYSGRKPPISKAFAWKDGEIIKAVCTFGKPASAPLCKGICGPEWAPNVYELNRLCRTDDLALPLSMFVGGVLRRLKKENWIIVSYSDTAMNHHGYVYQASNFIYTGVSPGRTDKYVPEGKHPRHYKDAEQQGFRKVRSAKHRYVYFASNKKPLINTWKKALRYPVEKYPKGDNSPDYALGYVLKDKLIRSNNEQHTHRSE